jgi:hypothetical protein
MIIEVLASIQEWNAARYDQVYNFELTSKLLKEEYDEYITAVNNNDIVDQADALADIIFVSVGALWKQGQCNISALIDSLLIKVTSNCFLGIPDLSYAIQAVTTSPASAMLHQVIVSAWFQLLKLVQMKWDVTVLIMNAICISNHTKAIAKIFNTEKYSISGKGALYQSPKSTLQTILKDIAR